MKRALRATVLIFALLTVAFVAYGYTDSAFSSFMYKPNKVSAAFETNDPNLPKDKQIVKSLMYIADKDDITINPLIRSELEIDDAKEVYLIVETDDPVYSIDVAGHISRPITSMPANPLEKKVRHYFFIVPRVALDYFYSYKVFHSKVEQEKDEDKRLDVIIGPSGEVSYDFFVIQGEKSVIYAGDIELPPGISTNLPKPNEDETYVILETSISNVGEMDFGDCISNKYIYKYQYYGSKLYHYLFILPKSFIDTGEQNFKPLPKDFNNMTTSDIV